MLNLDPSSLSAKLLLWWYLFYCFKKIKLKFFCPGRLQACRSYPWEFLSRATSTCWLFREPGTKQNARSSAAAPSTGRTWQRHASPGQIGTVGTSSSLASACTTTVQCGFSYSLLHHASSCNTYMVKYSGSTDEREYPPNKVQCWQILCKRKIRQVWK